MFLPGISSEDGSPNLISIPFSRAKESCGWIAPVTSYPGEFEQEAMAAGALRVLRGEEEAKIYPGKPVWEGF